MNLVFSTYNSYMKMTKTLSINWGTGNAVSFDGLHGVTQVCGQKRKNNLTNYTTKLNEYIVFKVAFISTSLTIYLKRLI